MKKLFFILIIANSSCVFSQKKDSTAVNKLKEVTLTSYRQTTNGELLPQQVKNITSKEIEFQNFQNTADVLSNSGMLTVQKSQQGGGSPVIRGFEASRVLILVDGIRMNNLIFRTGHLQNVITVDEDLLENVSVYFGPTSTLFGSDALGGTINLTTKKPLFSNDESKNIKCNLTTRYATVNKEQSASYQFNYSSKKWATLTSFSFADFGDLRMGKVKNRNGDFFGERNFYVASLNDVDVLIKNTNPLIQINSGYQQYSLMQKVRYQQKHGEEHGLNIQFSNSSTIPRYDRLTDKNETGLRNAQWYYGPQKRLLAVYSFIKEKAFLKSNLKLDVAYQNVQESRHNRRFGADFLQNRIEKVNLYSISLDVHKPIKFGDLYYGAESYLENLQSSAFANHVVTNEIRAIDTRYPNGTNIMSRNEMYISYQSLLSKKTTFTVGARIGYTFLKSTIQDDTFFRLPFSKILQKNKTHIANIGLVHKPAEQISIKTNISTGFRVPNIDDLAKIFESGGGFIIVPNANLKPEKTITTDICLGFRTKKNTFFIENTYYYTRFIDAIITDFFTYNGATTINYDGVSSKVVANQNKRKAFVTGFSSQIGGEIIPAFSYNISFNYTLGRISEENSQTPLDHIPPYYGKIGIDYHKKWLAIAAYILYNGKKPIDDYFLNGEDNEQYAPAGGMSAWETYNFKTSFDIFEKGTLFMGVENILDTQYRVFASGINAPGRNFYTGFKYEF